MIFWRVKRRIIAEVAEIIAPIRHKFYRMKVINKNVSIISQNCLGGVISHDLGLRFLSPTVNLYMTSSDFMLFVENLRLFKDADMRFIQSDRNYPVAECFLGEKKITIYFVHYHSCEEAQKKWRERYTRINYENVRVVMTDRDGLTEDILDRFEKLPYKKILFSAKILDMKDTIFVKEFSGKEQVGDLISFSTLFGKRVYEKFNIVKWIND